MTIQSQLTNIENTLSKILEIVMEMQNRDVIDDNPREEYSCSPKRKRVAYCTESDEDTDGLDEAGSYRPWIL